MFTPQAPTLNFIPSASVGCWKGLYKEVKRFQKVFWIFWAWHLGPPSKLTSFKPSSRCCRSSHPLSSNVSTSTPQTWPYCEEVSAVKRTYVCQGVLYGLYRVFRIWGLAFGARKTLASQWQVRFLSPMSLYGQGLLPANPKGASPKHHA